MKKNIVRDVALFISIISLLAQSISPLVVSLPQAYAQEVTQIEEVSPIPTEAPVDSITSTSTPDEVAPINNPTPTPEDSPTATLTPPLQDSPTPIDTQSVDNLSPPADGSLISSEPSAILTTPSEWTFENVELNKEYVAPQNSGVKLTFTKLPSPAGNIKIEEITLTEDQIKQTGSLSDKAYDITSNMVDGSFEYNLSLPNPNPQQNIKVKFSEDGQNFNTLGGVTAQDDILTITGLDHFTIFVVTGIITEISCVVPPSDMTNWWTGDGHANDITGGSGGTLNDNAAYSTGKVSQAFSFDGTGDYVQMPDPVGDFGSSSFTVDFWMNSNDDGPGTYIIGKSHANGGLGWDLRLNNNTIQVVGVNGWPAQYNFASDASVTSGVWHHIALTSTETEVNLYIDGILKGTSPRSTISSTSNPFRAGWTTDFGGFAFNGLIDEVEIFSRALSAGEVAGIYNASSAGKCKTEVSTSTVEATPFNESAADVVINEFIYHPSSGNDEWAELFNKTDNDIPLTGWTLVDGAGNIKSLSSLGSLPAHGIVVYESTNSWLDNIDSNGDGDTVILKNNDGVEISKVTYQKSSVDITNTQSVSVTDPSPGKSIARTTDGGETWAVIDTPTKGWFNDAETFNCVNPPSRAPTLTSIANCLEDQGLSTNIGTIENPSATPDTEAGDALYFGKDEGKIVFEKNLNLSDQDTVSILQSLGTAMAMSDGHIEFDSDTADKMNATGAKIYMYGLSFEETPDIIIKNDAGEILGTNDPEAINLDSIVYDADDGELSFTALHFTQFDLPSAPSAPVLNVVSSPTNDTTPTLSWNDVSATPEVTSYDVEVYDPDQNSIYGVVTTTSSSFTPEDPLPDGDYTWDVRANNAIGSSELSDQGSFTIDTVAPDVSKLGDGESDYSLPDLGDERFGATLIFSEELSATSKTAVENALTAGADKTLTFKWGSGSISNKLRIFVTGDSTATFANDVIVSSVTDLAGNTTTDLLLVDSLDTSAPTISSETSSSVTSTSTTITWTTDELATSRVIYDTVSHALATPTGDLPFDKYGYANTTGESNTGEDKTTSHSVGISDLTAGTTYYYRVISHGSPEAVGDEESFTTTSPTTSTTSGAGDGLSDGRSDGRSDGGSSGGGGAPTGGGVLGLATGPTYESVLGAQIEPESQVGQNEEVLGTESASPTLEPTLTEGQNPTGDFANSFFGNNIILLLIFLLLLLLLYYLYRRFRKK